MANYVIGLDYGTLSVRALLVNAKTGEELATSVYEYPHGVIDKELPFGTPLEADYALQHPEDYVRGLTHTINEVLHLSGINRKDISGVGVDFTACTMIPVREDGTPLCYLEEFKSDPESYVKLWKHHAAQNQADRINAVAIERNEPWLSRYGGKVNSEWELPKIMEVYYKSSKVYNSMRYYAEAADWIVWMMTGRYVRNACAAGYKGLWNKKDGYPGKDFFRALDKGLENVIEEKFDAEVLPLGRIAGYIDAKGAELTGLTEGTAVAVPIIDAHAALPAAKIKDKGKLLAIIGTSACHIVLGEDKPIKGISGVVEDGILPGYFAYEAGQAASGDILEWAVANIVPDNYQAEALKRGIGIYRLLDEKGEMLSAGESGLLSLDWFNGNRSILSDSDLTGAIIGLKLTTKPEEIYRCFVEGTAFGTRIIVENFINNGVEIDEIIAAGGIADKSPFIMQIYSDILNMPIKIAGSSQSGALGSAIFASVAAGAEKGGYDDIREAIDNMGRLKDVVYYPKKENTLIYNQLFEEYKTLHNYFGRECIMKRLKKIGR